MPGVQGQALLVAGSAVGAGLLALPAVTWAAGFWPSVVALVGTWLYMSATGVLLVEAAALDTSKANLLGIVGLTLGDGGQRVALVLYLAIYVATLTAYLAEGGRQAVGLLATGIECVATFADGCTDPRRVALSSEAVFLGQLSFALVFGVVISHGPRLVERINTICMGAAVLAFTMLVYFALRAAPATVVGQQQSEVVLAGDGLGSRVNWGAVPAALPVMVVAFSYHNTVPSVFATLSHRARDAALALSSGSGIALVMYIVWQAVVLGGPPPRGDEGDADAAPSKEQIFAALQSSAGVALPLFSLLALITSLLGVGLGCVDFIQVRWQVLIFCATA